MKKVNLDSENELIIRSNKEYFSDKYGRRQYHKSIEEVILKRENQLLCIGICFSNTFTGADEFVQYNPQCILFFRGNSITKQYRVDRVFDIATMQSNVITKEEIKERYDIDLPEEVKDPLQKKNRRRIKTSVGNRRLAYVANS